VTVFLRVKATEARAGQPPSVAGPLLCGNVALDIDGGFDGTDPRASPLTLRADPRTVTLAEFCVLLLADVHW